MAAQRILPKAWRAASRTGWESLQSFSSLKPVSWILTGAPGVGKGTYSSRLAGVLNAEHIAAGSLVRDEIKRGTPVGLQAKSIVDKGNLLPDDMVLELVHKRITEGRQRGELGFLLDGIPRTRAQAEALDQITDTRLVVNLTIREEVLTAKCLGRRVCCQCGKNFNVADIMLPATESQSEIRMPPLSPPPACASKMETRSDDTLETIKNRLEVYKAEASPVEEHYAAQGRLLNFEITGGIPETLPRLIDSLRPYSSMSEQRRAYQAHLLSQQQAQQQPAPLAGSRSAHPQCPSSSHSSPPSQQHGAAAAAC